MKKIIIGLLVAYVLTSCNRIAVKDESTLSVPLAAQTTPFVKIETASSIIYSDLENETESSAISPQKIEEIKKEYWYFYEKEDYILFVEENDGKYGSTDRVECRLFSRLGDFDKRVIIEPVGTLHELPEYFFMKLEDIEVEIDTDEKTVLITVYKNNYFLDFNAETVTFKQKYRLQDLDEKNRFISPDNSFELRTTEVFGANEIEWGDLVVVDKATNDIWYLDVFVSYIDPIFIGNDKILLCDPQSIRLYDLTTRASLTEVPQFDCGVSIQRDDRPFYYIIGAAYDKESNEILIAYRESTFSYDEEILGLTHEVFIDIFGSDGQKIKTVETGILTQAEIFMQLNPVYLTLKGNREVLLSSYLYLPDESKYLIEKKALGTVEY